MTCQLCGTPYTSNIPNQKFCSVACRINAWSKKSQVRSQYKARGIPTATVGAISELRVAADLLSKGYEVFRALSHSCSCDLAILQGAVLKRIEVRTGYYCANGAVSFPKKERDVGRQDHFAICLEDTIIYNPPLAPAE